MLRISRPSRGALWLVVVAVALAAGIGAGIGIGYAVRGSSVDSLKTANQLQQEELTEAATQLELRQSRIDALAGDQRSLEDRLGDLREKTGRLQSQLDGKIEEIETLQEQVTDLENRPAVLDVEGLDQLRDQARYVFAYVGPEDLAAQPALHQADATLVLVSESSAGNVSPAIAASPERDDRQTSIVLISEGRSATTVGDVRKARASLGSQWRAVHVIPGGVQAFDREPLDAPWSSHAVDRLARAVAGLTVGLALGGGGAKGYAHIGVVKGLQRAGVLFDYVVGCSIGAPLAAGVAAGWSPEDIKDNLDTISKKAVRPTLPFLSILTSRSIRSELQNLAGDQRFDDLPTPLGIVAVDIVTGEEVLLRSGLVWQAMLASMAYPGIYEPVHLDDRYLVDGAVLNPVPVSAAVTLGADVIISSGFGPSSEDRNGQPRATRKGRRPMILGTIARSLEIMQSKIGRESSARADVAIQSVFEETPGLLDFKRGRELSDVGLQAVEQALPKLRTVLPWLA